MIRKCILALAFLTLSYSSATAQELATHNDEARAAMGSSRPVSAAAIRIAKSTALALPNQTSDWQREYEDAEARRASGKKKILVGAVVTGVGLVGTVMGPLVASDSVGAGSTLFIMGLLTDLAGTGIMAWGWVQNSDAKEDLRALNSRRPATRDDGATFSVTGNQGLSLSVGRGNRIQYRLTW